MICFLQKVVDFRDWLGFGPYYGIIHKILPVLKMFAFWSAVVAFLSSIIVGSMVIASFFPTFKAIITVAGFGVSIFASFIGGVLFRS